MRQCARAGCRALDAELVSDIREPSDKFRHQRAGDAVEFRHESVYTQRRNERRPRARRTISGLSERLSLELINRVVCP